MPPTLKKRTLKFDLRVKPFSVIVNLFFNKIHQMKNEG